MERMTYTMLLGTLWGLLFALPGCDQSLEPGENQSGEGLQIVMLGDSITRRTDWGGLGGGHAVFNHGVDGDTTAGMRRRLPDVMRLTPDICFVMGGINDLDRGVSVQRILENLQGIAAGLMDQGIRPVMQTTLYVSERVPNHRALNRTVGDLNRRLEDYCLHSGIDFLDINRLLADGESLQSRFTLDGVHLSAEGYAAWSRHLASWLDQRDPGGCRNVNRDR